MAQQTAVEQFWDEIVEILQFDESETVDKLNESYQQAKQMEKEQLHKCASFWRGKECEIEKQIFDQYYNETYGNKEPKDVVLGYKTSLDAQMLDKVGLKNK